MPSEQEVGILIKAREQAQAAVGRTKAELISLSSAISRMRKEMAAGRGDAQLMGQMMQRQQALAQQLGAQMRALTSQTSAFRGVQQAAAAAVASHTGPLGSLAMTLGVAGTAAGIATLSVAAFGVAVLGAARGIADYQEQLDLMAERTGFTTSQLAGFRVAASEQGRSFEQIRPALDYFTRKVGEVAAKVSEAVKVFSDLGVGVRDAAGEIRPTGDIFRDLQIALSAIEDPVVRARFAMQLFGRSGAASINALLVPMDEVTLKAEKMGLALGPKAAEQARQADVAFDSLGTSMAGIGNAFGVVAARIANPFLDNLAKASVKIAEFVNNPDVVNFREFMFLVSAGTLKSSTLAVAFSGGIQPRIDTSVLFNPPNRPWGTKGVIERPVEEVAAAAKKFAEEAAKYMRQETSKPLDMGTASIMGTPEDLTAANLEKVRQTLKLVNDDALRLAEGMALLDEKMEEGKKETNQLVDSVGAGFADAVSGMVSMVIRGVDDIGAAFEQMILQIIADIAAQAIGKGIRGLLGVPFQSGGTIDLQAGGTMVRSSFSSPIRAQSGLVMDGVRGFDGVAALLGYRETVLSHGLTDMLSSFLMDMRAVVPAMRAGVLAGAGRSGGERPVQINLTYQGGSGDFRRDKGEMHRWLRDDVYPGLRRASSRGTRF